MELTVLWGCLFGLFAPKKVAEICGNPDDFAALDKDLGGFGKNPHLAYFKDLEGDIASSITSASSNADFFRTLQVLEISLQD